uniref:HSF-type DNA-binding domain-containing protein n=1 Tax=Entomoneis paludosa TaxID=265537 RepID=A0A7S2VDW0_9STRA|mmetsp:Transcript_14653/g.30252  ORF Transcript_14653/g.30252 Transcript_14653/m.30252 type:complete len:259 (+) Transcript_14653:194-970(+)
MFNTESPLASFSFPRTGKRGVPQQFPRRLYEMLENETKMAEQQAAATGTFPTGRAIMWSDSGKAFRIFDVTEFANTVLPKYFRTKKFSSFQRNLNLYGFAKVRRGPETDMYAHPSFLRNEPEGLLNLRKVTAASRRVMPSTATYPRTNNNNHIKGPAPSLMNHVVAAIPASPVRAISPSSASSSSSSSSGEEAPAMSKFVATPPVTPTANTNAVSTTTPTVVPASPPLAAQGSESPKGPDRGRLDLLAFALEQEAYAA